MFGRPRAAVGHFQGARKPGRVAGVNANVPTTKMTFVTPDEEIAALDAEIARYEKALERASVEGQGNDLDTSLAEARRRDLEELLATLHAVRRRLLRER